MFMKLSRNELNTKKNRIFIIQIILLSNNNRVWKRLEYVTMSQWSSNQDFKTTAINFKYKTEYT